MRHARGRDADRRAQRRGRRRRTGLLVDDPIELAAALERVLADDALRARCSAGALAHASRFTWAATARGTLEVLAAEALRRRRS